jgi:hypothetical protein
VTERLRPLFGGIPLDQDHDVLKRVERNGANLLISSNFNWSGAAESDDPAADRIRPPFFHT